jgi:hypothetical protein
MPQARFPGEVLGEVGCSFDVTSSERGFLKVTLAHADAPVPDPELVLTVEPNEVSMCEPRGE